MASGRLTPNAGESGYDLSSGIPSLNLTPRMAPLPFESGVIRPSSSIWNIRSLADCLDLSIGLLLAFGDSLGGAFFPLRVDEDAVTFSIGVCRDLTSYDSRRSRRVCKAMASI